MPYHLDVRKTSVYLTEEEAEGLRRTAAETGRSRAELVRDGLHWVLMTAGGEPRRFHSMGAGRGGGRSYTPWDPDEVYDASVGRE